MKQHDLQRLGRLDSAQNKRGMRRDACARTNIYLALLHRLPNVGEYDVGGVRHECSNAEVAIGNSWREGMPRNCHEPAVAGSVRVRTAKGSKCAASAGLMVEAAGGVGLQQ